MLHRPPDPGGEAYWLGLLETGTSRTIVVVGFSESPEYKGNEKAGLEAYIQNSTPWQATCSMGDRVRHPIVCFGAGRGNVNLGMTGPQETFGAGIDTLTNIENLTGSSFDDRLTGEANPNVLSGGLGNDILDSSGGLEHDWAGQAYRLYETTLDRGPDPGGFDYWITQLHEGMSLNAAAPVSLARRSSRAPTARWMTRSLSRFSTITRFTVRQIRMALPIGKAYWAAAPLETALYSASLRAPNSSRIARPVFRTSCTSKIRRKEMPWMAETVRTQHRMRPRQEA